MNKTPQPFCYDKKKIKTFVLGADPSNFSNKGKTNYLPTVFGIGTSDSRYFKTILDNLKQIGINLDEIYVQNLIREYLTEETSHNKDWEIIAKSKIKERKKEFDKIDPACKIPVLVTAERILKFLLNNPDTLQKPSEYYNFAKDLPIKAFHNKLGRPLLPFYRHYRYILTNNKWNKYLTKLKN